MKEYKITLKQPKDILIEIDLILENIKPHLSNNKKCSL